jgi:hypothetical protein
MTPMTVMISGIRHDCHDPGLSRHPWLLGTVMMPWSARGSEVNDWRTDVIVKDLVD